MRKAVLTLCTLLTLAACGSAREDGGPDVGSHAAPGVKFSYRYVFQLPDQRIAEVQEQHAQACERLGLARCRITSMRYRLTQNDEVEALLALRLDPAIARQFGKEGIEAVKKASGGLVDSEIDGALTSAPRTAPVGADEPATLPADIAAMTPMVFDYDGGAAMAGLGSGRIGAALNTALASFVTMVSLILIAVGAAAPWALALAGVIALWRSGLGRSVRRLLGLQPDAI